MNVNRLSKWIPLIVYIGVIFFMSITDGESSGSLSYRLSMMVIMLGQRLSDYTYTSGELDEILRQFAHFMEYYVLGVLLIRSYIQEFQIKLGFIIISVIVSGLFVAIIDEMMVQGLLAIGRNASSIDIMTDMSGVVVAILTFLSLIRPIKNYRRFH